MGQCTFLVIVFVYISQIVSSWRTDFAIDRHDWALERASRQARLIHNSVHVLTACQAAIFGPLIPPFWSPPLSWHSSFCAIAFENRCTHVRPSMSSYCITHDVERTSTRVCDTIRGAPGISLVNATTERERMREKLVGTKARAARFWAILSVVPWDLCDSGDN